MIGRERGGMSPHDHPDRLSIRALIVSTLVLVVMPVMLALLVRFFYQ